MSIEEIEELDNQVSDAYANLVALNNEYNELLTENFNQSNKKVVSDKVQNLNNKLSYLKIGYMLVILIDLFAKTYMGLPNNVYLSIFFGDIFILQVGTLVLSYKIRKEKAATINNTTIKKNKDELYNELCQARELYHLLRKQRDNIPRFGKVLEDKNIPRQEKKIKTLEFIKK